MLYKEFTKKLAELGLYFEYGDYGTIRVYTSRQVTLATIDDNYQYDLFLSSSCGSLSPEVREKFFKLALEYASTPVEARAEEKKYNVVAYREKGGYPDNIVEDTLFYWRANDGCLFVANGKSNGEEEQQWTMSQIREYDLEDCERIEITGED